MRRPSILATAILAAIALAAIAATSGGAKPSPRTRTIHLTLVQTGGFDSPGPPRPGFVHAFTDKVTSDDGSKGHDVGLCTLITRSELLCHSQVILTTGQLAYQGILHQHDHNTPGTVLGGTGDYNGARGTAHVTDISPTTAKITINLVG